ncbi:hypothetical protein QJS04_geneDACA018543 [Acorus gramineus]|uniref:Uncharacterized protein n=1 Tax=Acorus gramineus TaxID=55184 RepID=A0AAV9BXB0_ACOGR|nr:hypothetical protein QJS04_geneDACA018541 [Acorus gramineus]KAK1280848.1 hypothetical protein QJS04_geneDACA018543 [Acorus gramineus]
MSTATTSPLLKPKWNDLSFVSFLGSGSLAVNSIIAAYRSRDDIPTVLFIVISNAVIFSLLWSIHAHERALRGSTQKKWYKIFIWSLAALLNVGFAWKVTQVLPLLMSSVLWVLVAACTVGTFYLYFVVADRKS